MLRSFICGSIMDVSFIWLLIYEFRLVFSLLLSYKIGKFGLLLFKIEFWLARTLLLPAELEL